MSDMREKLINEAIAHFDYGVTHDIFSEPVTTYAKLAGAALAYIRHVPDTDFGKWIPVSERLPEKDGHYLCNYHFGDYPKMRFTQVLDYYATDIVPHFQHTLCDGSMKVTHWMPIPEPPKGE